MYWMARPPYLRIAIAVSLAIVALARDLRPADTVAHPFARTAIPAGSEITDANVEMRAVPPGLLTSVDLPALAARPIDSGAPITVQDVGFGIVPPPGWPTIAVEAPFEVAPGVEVVLVVGGLDMVPTTVPGVVIGVAGGSGLGLELTAIAVPPDRAIDVAVAHRTGQLDVLLGG